MPFTVCHVAAAVPLIRYGLVPSALVAGSMAPDLEYFLFLSLNTERSWHSLRGALLYAVPAGLLLLWIYHVLLKLPLLSLLSTDLQRRLQSNARPFAFGPTRRFLMLLFSVGIGVLTHVLWDSFTHTRGWHGMPLALLATPIVQTPWGAVRVHNLLQYLSSAAGATALFVWYLRWASGNPLWIRHAGVVFGSRPVRVRCLPPLSASASRKQLLHAFGRLVFAFWAGVARNLDRLAILLAMTVAAVVFAVSVGISGSPTLFDPRTFRLLLSRTTVVGGAAFAAELVAFSLFWHLDRNLRIALSGGAIERPHPSPGQRTAGKERCRE